MKVKNEDVMRLRLKLAGEGLPRGQIGWEQFDKQDFLQEQSSNKESINSEQYKVNYPEQSTP